MKMTWRDYVYNTIEAILIVAWWIVAMIIAAGFGLLALAAPAIPVIVILWAVKLLFF